MKIDKNIAANAIRLSVGRETTKKQIDTVVEDIKNALEIITSSQRTVI
jgi:cysteine sulfinate desulfinase/cysteine desulfurase-like protein